MKGTVGAKASVRQYCTLFLLSIQGCIEEKAVGLIIGIGYVCSTDCGQILLEENNICWHKKIYTTIILAYNNNIAMKYNLQTWDEYEEQLCTQG